MVLDEVGVLDDRPSRPRLVYNHLQACVASRRRRSSVAVLQAVPLHEGPRRQRSELSLVRGPVPDDEYPPMDCNHARLRNAVDSSIRELTRAATVRGCRLGAARDGGVRAGTKREPPEPARLCAMLTSAHRSFVGSAWGPLPTTARRPSQDATSKTRGSLYSDSKLQLGLRRRNSVGERGVGARTLSAARTAGGTPRSARCVAFP